MVKDKMLNGFMTKQEIIEKNFGCAIVMRDIKAIITLQDLYDYIENNC